MGDVVEQIFDLLEEQKNKIQELRELLRQRNASIPNFITAETTMTLLDCDRSTFDRLRKAGIIKVYRLRRKLYCKHEEIIQALENGLVN